MVGEGLAPRHSVNKGLALWAGALRKTLIYGMLSMFVQVFKPGPENVQDLA